MNKSKYIVFDIFLESLGFYCLNFLKFFKYMFYPVFGQVFGIVLSLGLIYLFVINFELLQLNFDFLNEPKNFMLGVFIVAIPGCFFFIDAFLKYVLAYGSLNSVAKSLLKYRKVYDFDAHDAVVKNNLLKFVKLYGLFVLFLSFFSCPLLCILGFLIFIFFILIFQLFILEPKLSVLSTFKRSFVLVKPYYLESLFLVLLLGSVLFVILPQLIILIFDIFNLSKWLIIPINKVVSLLPIYNMNLQINGNAFPITLEPVQVSNMVLFLVLNFIVIGLTLPVRSICCSLWYDFLKEEFNKKSKKKKGKK